MLEIEYEILKWLMTNGPATWTDALNVIDPSQNCNISNALLARFLKCGLIQQKDHQIPPLSKISITEEGVWAVLTYEQAAKEKTVQKAEEERKHRKEHLFTALLSIFCAVLGGILGAFFTLR